MTVHGAKGLESNIVILPDTCAMPHRMARAQMLPIDGVPIWSARKSEDPAPLAAARGFVDAAEEAEHLRLLYVALTRARDRLYICGYETNRAPDPLCWYALAEAAMTRIATQVTQPSGETVYRLETPQTAKPDGRAETTAAAVKADRLPGWIALPASPEPPARRTVSPSSLGGNLEPPVLSPRKPDNAPARFGRGRLIHRLLQTLPDLAGERRAATAARFLALPRHGLSPEEQAEIAQSVLAVLARTDFAPVFAPGSRAEVPVVGQLALRSGPVSIFGIVDRLAVTDEAVLIVDYKTNRPPPATADAVAPAYLSQMAAYAAVLGSIYPGRAIKTALLWTESLILMALPAEALAAALP
jgi:ATP-dependent helicase/nuclease subunit A